jgi:hypothetical protein
MRKLVIFFLGFIVTDASGQNEFAATAFYSDFKKIHADAQTGFTEYKGAKKWQERGTGTDEFAVKLMLPLADSGKIVFPVNGTPYAEYFFQSSKKKQETDQRAVNLREALLTIVEKPLYTRTETLTFKKIIFSTTYYFTTQETIRPELAVFSSHIGQHNGRYILSFRIMGKKILPQS